MSKEMVQRLLVGRKKGLICVTLPEYGALKVTRYFMRAQLIRKSKKETRFCINGSTQKNILGVTSYPMPHIRQIFAVVAGFPFRAKIDLKHGYHNFEIDPASRKWTVTSGPRYSVQKTGSRVRASTEVIVQ
jgi:hypothetical protein